MKKTRCGGARLVVVLLGAVGTVALFSGCEEDDNGPPPDANGYALAIGLNKVDPAHYGGWDGELSGCEPDAMDMQQIATNEGLDAERLLTAEATRDAVLKKLGDLAEKLTPGDLLVVSYSGHGGQMPDQNGDEADGRDETWCLYDGEVLDDELYGAWMKFQAGVRILVFSDSCHSGTVLKMIRTDWESPPAGRIRELDDRWKTLRVPAKLDRAKFLAMPEMRKAIKERAYLRDRIRSLPPSTPRPGEAATPTPPEAEAERIFVSRAMPPGISATTYQQNKTFYDELGEAAPREDSAQVKASVILISGCEDAQASADIGFNGLFTWMLKRVWNNGAFTGDHRKFREDIRQAVEAENSEQSPYFFEIGEDDEHREEFIQQQPYTVE